MDACEVRLSLLKGGMLHPILVLWTPCCVSETLSIFVATLQGLRGCSDHMQAGQKEVLISKLPGFLDGITTSSSGTFWVAVVVPKMDLVRFLSNK